MPVELIAKIQQKNNGAFKLIDVADLDAGNLDVVMQLIAGGGVVGGVHATTPVGEIAVQRKTTTGAPTHVATGATLCWNEVDEILYASQGAGAWVSVGSGTHPNLAVHDALGLATDAELTAHAAVNAADLAAHAARAGHIFDVEDYAPTGGGANDTTAIQAAIDAAYAAGGGTVVVRKHYKAGGLLHRSHVTLRGEGGSITDFAPTSNPHNYPLSTAITVTTGDVTATTLVVASATGVEAGCLVGIVAAGGGSAYQYTRLGGGGLDGSSTTITADETLGTTWASTGGYLTIDSEIIAYTGKSGTDFTGCTRGALGTSAASHAAGATVSWALRHVVEVTAVSGTTLTLRDAAPLAVTGASVDVGVVDAHVRDLIVDAANPTHNPSSAIAFLLASRSSVKGCTSKNSTLGQGIVLSRGSAECSVVDNTVIDGGNSTTGIGFGILLFNGCRRCTVRGNRVLGVSNSGISLDDRSSVGNNYDAPNVGNVIEGNVIRFVPLVNNSQPGVGVQGSYSNTISGNDISGPIVGITLNTAGQGTVPISPDHNIIEGNNIHGIVGNGVVCAGRFNMIQGNRIDDVGNGVNIATPVQGDAEDNLVALNVITNYSGLKIVDDGVRTVMFRNGSPFDPIEAGTAEQVILPDALGGLGTLANLLRYSEAFDNAAWTKNGVTITADSVAGPSGSGLADTYTDAAGAKAVSQTYSYGSSLEGRTFTASLWVRGGTGTGGDRFRLRIDDAASENLTAAGDEVDLSTTEWQQLVYTYTFTGTGTNVRVVISGTDLSVGETAYIFGAQLVETDVATPYVATGATVLGTFGLQLNGGALVVPSVTSPSQTVEGSVVWDSDDDHLTVGTGAGRKTLGDTDDLAALAARFDGMVDPMDPVYGALGDGIADDAGALNAADAAAFALGGTVTARPGSVFRTSSPVVFTASVYMPGATIVPDTGVNYPVTVGTGTAYYSGKWAVLPDIRRTVRNWTVGDVPWDDPDVGLVLNTVINSHIFIGTITNFSIGVQLKATSPKGAAYNTFYLRSLATNKVSVDIQGTQGASVTISTASYDTASQTITYTSATDHGLDVGFTAGVTGATNTAYNGSRSVIDVPSLTTFVVHEEADPGAWVGGGSAIIRGSGWPNENNWHGGRFLQLALGWQVLTASWSGGVATYTTTNVARTTPVTHNLIVGTTVKITGALNAAYNVTAVVASVPTTSTFTVAIVSDPSSWTGGGVPIAAGRWYPGARQIRIGRDGIAWPNNQRFYGASLEGNTAEYIVESWGANNLFDWCRWEATNPRVWYRDVTGGGRATGHTIRGGYKASGVSVTDEGRSNQVDTANYRVVDGLGGNQGVIRARNKSGSSTTPIFVGLPADVNPHNTADVASLYGYLLSAERSYFKAKDDTVPRIYLRHTDGTIFWGSGAASVDTSLARTDVGEMTSAFTWVLRRVVQTRVTLTDAATIAVDASAGAVFSLTASSGVGASRTISAPTNGKTGQQITFTIVNSTGGTMTTTFDAAYVVEHPWSDPANGVRRSITFNFNGTVWIEVARSALPLTTATPSAVGTAAVGTATLAPHADHVHAASGDTPSTQASGDAAAAGTSAKGAQSDHKHAFPDLYVPFVFSKGGVLTTATGAFRIYNDTGRTLTIAKIRASVGTPPTTQSILCDVNIDGTTIWTTGPGTNRVAITAGSNTGTQTSFDTTTIADGHYFTVDVDQIGTGTAGSDLTVAIWCKG